MQTAQISSINLSIQQRWLIWLWVLLGGLNPLGCLWHCGELTQANEINLNRDAGMFICLLAESQPPASNLHVHAPSSNPDPVQQGVAQLHGFDSLALDLNWLWQQSNQQPLIWQSQPIAPPLAPPPELR
ncbi:hypothetical protein [Herpetosiphon gulosus]|uniref:Uncharacterized protein n=1 Tax=Herpetosiphon gulosus TaxID=1973496 RepID=A0ABP9X3E0_9CHLR